MRRRVSPPALTGFRRLRDVRRVRRSTPAIQPLPGGLNEGAANFRPTHRLTVLSLSKRSPPVVAYRNFTQFIQKAKFSALQPPAVYVYSTTH